MAVEIGCRESVTHGAKEVLLFPTYDTTKCCRSLPLPDKLGNITRLLHVAWPTDESTGDGARSQLRNVGRAGHGVSIGTTTFTCSCVYRVHLSQAPGCINSYAIFRFAVNFPDNAERPPAPDLTGLHAIKANASEDKSVLMRHSSLLGMLGKVCTRNQPWLARTSNAQTS